MTYEERQKAIQIQNNTFGTLYNVCYLKHWNLYGKRPVFKDDEIIEYCKCEKLRVDNINGYGIGVVYFINEKNQMVVLPWCAIISMTPVNEGNGGN